MLKTSHWWGGVIASVATNYIKYYVLYPVGGVCILVRVWHAAVVVSMSFWFRQADSGSLYISVGRVGRRLSETAFFV